MIVMDNGHNLLLYVFYYLKPGVHTSVLSGSTTYLPEPLPSTVRRLSIIVIIIIIIIIVIIMNFGRR